MVIPNCIQSQKKNVQNLRKDQGGKKKKNRKGKEAEKIKNKKRKISPQGFKPTAFGNLQITSTKTIPLDKPSRR